jgi:type II secretory pathway pseudopilin PulG
MKRNIMKNRNKNIRNGFTLIEIVVAIVINMIVISGVGVLLVGGNRAWQKCYDSANNKIKQDALVTMLEFGNAGRKANRLCYTIYKNINGSYYPALPETNNPEEIVHGDAVEFRYWDEEIDSTDSLNLMDTSKMATAYAFFYIDDKKLKVDYGPCPPGAVPGSNGKKNTTGVTTNILAENVFTSDAQEGAFSHTTRNGVGQGSVRINITLKNPDNDESVQIMTATYLRNIWPR